MPRLYHVVAMARNRVIGKDNKLPWHYSADLKHFKQLTLGHTVIMGRKTFESIGRPLPGRANFILTHRPLPDTDEKLRYFDSLEKAFDAAATEKAFVIGGAKVYAQTLERMDGVYLTLIDEDHEGDAFYPELPDYFSEESRTKLQDNPRIEILYLANTKRGALHAQ